MTKVKIFSSHSFQNTLEQQIRSHIQNSDMMSVESHIQFVPNVRSSNSIVRVVE